VKGSEQKGKQTLFTYVSLLSGKPEEESRAVVLDNKKNLREKLPGLKRAISGPSCRVKVGSKKWRRVFKARQQKKSRTNNLQGSAPGESRNVSSQQKDYTTIEDWD